MRLQSGGLGLVPDAPYMMMHLEGGGREEEEPGKEPMRRRSYGGKENQENVV